MPVFTPFNFPFNTDKLISAFLQRKIKKHDSLLQKYGWLMCNISIKDLIVGLPGLFHNTAQSAQCVTIPKNMYSNKFIQIVHLNSVISYCRSF